MDDEAIQNELNLDISEFEDDDDNNDIDDVDYQQLRSFKMEIAETLVCANVSTSSETEDEEQPRPKRSKPAVPLPSANSRTHGALHLPSAGEAQNRCRGPGCNKKSTIICKKCNIHLCLTKGRNCFYNFHTEVY